MTDGTYLDNIARLDAISTLWTKAGNLITARNGHAAIFIDSVFLVIGGGYRTLMTEKCTGTTQNWLMYRKILVI